MKKRSLWLKHRTVIILIITVLCCCACNTVKEYADNDAEEQPSATLFCASDYQTEDGFKSPGETLSGILNSALEDGKMPTDVIMCGDYSNLEGKYNYETNPDAAIEEIRNIVGEACPDVKNFIFVQGNHDALTDEISASGLHDCGEYLVYVINTQNDYPWSQGVNPGCMDKVKRTSEELADCLESLKEKGEKRPIFIAGHVPLHYSARTSSRHTTGDNLYASHLFKAVNDAADSLNIIYLFGHNHSKGWDCYMGGSCVYKTAGDTLLVPSYDVNSVTSDTYTEENLHFTYVNAGYSGYYLNCSPGDAANNPDGYVAADMTLTATVFEIYSDRIVISRYDENGIHTLGAKGEANPYRGYIDRDLIDAGLYSTEYPGPAEIKAGH